MKNKMDWLVVGVLLASFLAMVAPVSAKDEVYEVVSPEGKPPVIKVIATAPRLSTLEGKTICESWNDGFGADVTFPILRQLLKERYPGVKVIPYNEFPSSPSGGAPSFQWERAKQIAALAKRKGCDALISGNGG